MSDSVRHHAPDHAVGEHAVDNDTRIEQLLLAGLDHYFGARYEAAIHIWTRALFLDRGHQRARAYIERARSALGERQRESEELLHKGVAAFNRGDIGSARTLLTSAVERGGSHDDVQVLLERLSRLEITAGRGRQERPRDGRTRNPPPARAEGTGHRMPSRVRRFWPLVVLVGGAAVGLYAVASWDRLEPLLTLPRFQPASTASAVPEQAVPRPSVSEIALERAQVLYERGRFHDSLRMLERIQPGSPFRPDAEALRAVIQRALVGGARRSPPSGNATEPR